jgi:hypothetical protein
VPRQAPADEQREGIEHEHQHQDHDDRRGACRGILLRGGFEDWIGRTV